MRSPWLLALALAGCTAELPREELDTASRRAACTVLEGRTFTAIEPADWQITFFAHDAARTRYEWDHAGVAETGFVSCAGDDIRSDEPTLYDGHFSRQLELFWDGAAYALVPAR